MKHQHVEKKLLGHVVLLKPIKEMMDLHLN